MDSEYSKVISPGIYLHKKQLYSIDDELMYIFQVEVDCLNIVEFSADFSESENISLEKKQNLVTVTTIMPYSTEIIAKVILKKNWKLKSKFSFVQKLAPKSFQLQFIQNDVHKLNQEINYVTKITSKHPNQNLKIQEINQYLTHSQIQFIDPEFLPNNESIYPKGTNQHIKQLESLVQWRRPTEFINKQLGQQLTVFYPNKINPLDLQQGELEDMWFLSTIAVLAERQSLIERILVTKDYNSQGVYQIKLCNNGQWKIVTIDDLIPCYPHGGPIFSSSKRNDIWILLLEKAYAKLNGGYLNLNFGDPRNAFIDFTGVPTETYDFSSIDIQQRIKEGQFWNFLVKNEQEGYILSAYRKAQNTVVMNSNDKSLSVQEVQFYYQSFYIIQLKQASEGQLVMNIRDPFNELQRQSIRTTQEKQNNYEEESKPFEIGNGSIWIKYQDFLSYFQGINICKVCNWEEVRLKGMFIKAIDKDDPNVMAVLSKWCYSFELQQCRNMVIGIHQEDERYPGVSESRPYLDIGLAVFKEGKNNQLQLYSIPQQEDSRQQEINLKLDPGKYIILPHTTGCMMNMPPLNQSNRIKLIGMDGNLNTFFQSTLLDIFRKFDKNLNNELSFDEFKGFFECINQNINQYQFETHILKVYPSTKKALSFKGFVDFFKDSIKQYGEEQMWQWLEMLGYDSDLFSFRSRCFMLSFHCEQELSIVVRDNLSTDYDNRINIEQVQFSGEEIKLEKQGIRIKQTMNKETQTYSFMAINELPDTVQLTVNLAGSKSAIYSTKDGTVTKIIEPGQKEFLMHLKQDNKTNQQFKLNMEYGWNIIKTKQKSHKK